MSDEDRQLEEILARALQPNPERTPPPERVAALRSQVEARAHHSGPIAPPTVVALAAQRQGRTGRRDLLVGGIAASIGLLAGVGGAVAVAGSDDDSLDGMPTEPITFASAPAGVTTEASLIDHTWGLELVLDVEGLPAGRDYQVLYTSTGGDAVLAGSFRSVDDVLMKCRFNAALLRADTTAVAVIDPDGTEVLRTDLA